MKTPPKCTDVHNVMNLNFISDAFIAVLSNQRWNLICISWRKLQTIRRLDTLGETSASVGVADHLCGFLNALLIANPFPKSTQLYKERIGDPLLFLKSKPFLEGENGWQSCLLWKCLIEFQMLDNRTCLIFKQAFLITKNHLFAFQRSNYWLCMDSGD